MTDGGSRNDDGDPVPEPDGPITPEVVGTGRGRGGAFGGFGGLGARGGGGGLGGRPGATVRIAAAALAALGALLAIYAVQLVTSPERAVCANARLIIKDELEEAGGGGGDGSGDEGDDGTTTTAGEAQAAGGGDDPVVRGGFENDEQVDEASCDEVLPVATEIDEGDDEVQLPTEGLVRSLGTVITITALVQMVGGVLTLRRRTKGVRTIAVVGAVLGALTSLIVGIGIIGVVLYLAIMFALVYSRDARATFGDPGGRFGGGRSRGAGGFGGMGAGARRPDPDDLGDHGDGGDDDVDGDDGGAGGGSGGPPDPPPDLPGGFAKRRK